MKKIQLVGVLAVAMMVLAGLPAWATVSDCVGVTFTFDDTTPSTGASSNNVRYLTVSGISVRVTGFSRATNGTWVTANVGAWSGGMGVEHAGDDSHTIDNLTRKDYMLFEFSRPVVVDQVYLGYVTTDSDLRAYVGTFSDPYNNHLTLSDAVLANFGYNETNLTSSSSVRWADLNAGKVSGNAFIVAAWPNDTAPNDQFKLNKVLLCEPPAATYDFGDLPVAYNTTGGGVAANAPRHTVSGSLVLGTARDAETNGIPTAAATGDDANNTDDEDGVSFGALYAGLNGTITANVTGTGGKLNAWVDWNNDGDFADAGEQIASNAAMASGANALTVAVPVSAALGTSLPARFRLSTAGGDAATSGTAADGEIEDYVLTVQAPASLGDFVWLDADADGIQDAGEAGLAGVVVRLYNAASNVVGTTTTSVAGVYGFANLVPGVYHVGFTVPAGYVVTLQDQGANDAADSDANAATGRTIPTTLVAGENDLTWDLGLYQTACLGDWVWNDADADGLQDAGEVGISNVTLQLKKCGITNVVATTVSATNGGYQFCNLAPGSYQVQVVTPSGWELTSRTNGPDNCLDSDADATGLSACVTLSGGTTNLCTDFGFFKRAGVGDLVWNDTDADGIQDAGEAGVPGVTVQLLACGVTNVLATQATDASGNYLFGNLKPGSYQVKFVLPSGYSFSPQDQGANDAADSDANTASGLAACVTLPGATTNRTVDAGIYRTACLGDWVWNDADADGLQDAGEAGISGVTLQLKKCGITNVVATATTGADGKYLFCDLVPGSYQVQVVTPAGWELTSRTNGPDNCLDSDADATGLSACVTLSGGTTNLCTDFGFFKRAGVGDLVWNDTDADGIQDAGEAGVPGVTVQLLACGVTNVLATQATDASGNYLFGNLKPGSYQVKFVLPSGYSFSPQDQGANDAADSDANTASGLAACVTLPGATTNRTVDAGIYRTACLGDWVWNDADADGLQDAGEAGISGVTLQLKKCGITNVVATATTGADGKYLFCDLVPGSYQVQVVTPAGWELTSRTNGPDNCLDSDADATGLSACVTLSGGTTNLCTDFGFFKRAGVGDLVWNDTDADGIQDAGEAGVPGVTVQLLACGVTNVLATQATDANGGYLFGNLKPGSYQVKFVLPAGYSFSPQDQGANDAADSDANAASGLAACVTLPGATTNRTVDAGIHQGASLGDLVWLDADADGIQDAGEAGIAGVVVRLYDAVSNVVGTTTTSVAGVYGFANLVPGDYHVGFTVPAGYVVSPQDQGADDAKDSDVNAATGRTVPTTLVGGENDLTWDLGLYQPACLGDFVWEDPDADGLQDAGETGIAGVTLELLACNGQTVLGTTMTDANGWYQFCNLVPGSYQVRVVVPGGWSLTTQNNDSDDCLDSDANAAGLSDCIPLESGETDECTDFGLFKLAAVGDLVWYDKNADGLQDSGEPGISNVVIKLYDLGDGVVGVTTTDVNGIYGFTNLPPGQYRVGVDLLPGWRVSAQNQGVDPTRDVDIDPLTGRTVLFALIAGQVDLTWDGGFYRLASIGDRVWEDADADGIQDPGEAGVPDVDVTLYNADSNAVAATETDANGIYGFTDLMPGTYFVGFDLPAGYSLSPQDQGADDEADSDADPATFRTIPTVLESAENDVSWDAGIYPVSSLGDRVWYDLDGDGFQDPAEVGLPNVPVSLYADPEGDGSVTTLQDSMLTDATGFYLFDNLLAGSYVVVVDPSALLGFRQTGDPDYFGLPLPAGQNDNRTTTPIVLPPNTSFLDADFGYQPIPLLSVIGSVEAFTRDGQTVVRWETLESWGTAGYYLERKQGSAWVRISDLVPFPLFGVAPIVFEAADPDAQAGGTYVYRLVEQDANGTEIVYGPYTLTVDGAGRTYEDWAAGKFTAAELADPAISGPNADPDGDGLTNAQEFLAGTDPKDANSLLQVNSIRTVSGGLEIGWDSVAGRSYRIAVTDSLTEPFLPLEEAILATDENGRIVLPLDFAERQLYFRVILADGSGN